MARTYDEAHLSPLLAGDGQALIADRAIGVGELIEPTLTHFRGEPPRFVLEV